MWPEHWLRFQWSAALVREVICLFMWLVKDSIGHKDNMASDYVETGM